MTDTRQFATRLLLTATVLAAAALAAAALGAPPVAAAPAALSLTETWNAGAGVTLDDAPCGVARSSPVEFDDNGTAAVEVGDRQGDLYGLDLQSGAVAAGWGGGTGNGVGPAQGCTTVPSGGTPATGIVGVEVPGSIPIDSTASVGPATARSTSAEATTPRPSTAATTPTRPTGPSVWNQVVTNPPTDTAPDGGVQASLSVADGGSLVEGGSLGQMTYALDAGNGAPATGWPQFSADSVFSTAAVGDLYGTGTRRLRRRRRVVDRRSPTGRTTPTAGTLRIYNDHGGLICRATTNEEVDSSPAVGPDPRRRRLRDRHGHGQLCSRHQRRRHRQGVRHPVQPGVERQRWTAPPAAARPWPTSGQRAAGRGRGHGHGPQTARSGP